jgi:hypothetical protein
MTRERDPMERISFKRFVEEQGLSSRMRAGFEAFVRWQESGHFSLRPRSAWSEAFRTHCLMDRRRAHV